MTADPDDRWTRTLLGGLVVRATQRADSPLINRFMAGYDQAFVLPNEREEIEGFRACLAINPHSRHRFGRIHCELVMVLEDGATGTSLGGANFLATGIPNPPDHHPGVAVALNYMFVDAQVRGRGLSRVLKQAVEDLAIAAVEGRNDVPPALFIEQNDPLRLSREAYLADSAHSGIDQIDRLAVWSHLGAQLIDFPYVQPALSANQRSDDGLAYAVLNVPLPWIDAGYFEAHLESFFAISVLKGADVAADPIAAEQLGRLREMAAMREHVPLLSLEGAVDALRSSRTLPAQPSLRSFARFISARAASDT